MTWLPLALLLLARSACAELQPVVEPSEGYLDDKSIEWVFFFPPPPLPGSVDDEADLAAVRGWQARRSAAQCARAQAEAKVSFKAFFGEISPLVSPLPPAAELFFWRVALDSVIVDEVVKRRFQRPRPYLRDPALSPCIDKAKGHAYPSGHAALARLYARILGALVPARRAEFLARSEEAALNRVIGGVHHPSDVEAGLRLGDALHGELLLVPSFLRDRESLRRFLRRSPRP